METQSALNPFDGTGDYGYYMLNGILYLNTDLDGKRRASVRYRYLTSYVTLKTVLATNGSKYYTPEVDSYTIKFLGD